MSNITISKKNVYINYINLLLKNLTCSVTMSFSGIKELISNSMFEKMRNTNKISFNEKLFSLDIFRNNRDTDIYKYINMILNNTLLFLKELHSYKVYHNNITYDAIYYKEIDNIESKDEHEHEDNIESKHESKDKDKDEYEYFFYVGKFENLSLNIDNLSSMTKGSMLKYYNLHNIKNYKEYVGTYKFDLYCLICTINKLLIEKDKKDKDNNSKDDEDNKIDDEDNEINNKINEMNIKNKLYALYKEYIENTNEDFQYDKLIEKEYITFIKDNCSKYTSGEENTFILDNIIPSNTIDSPSNMYLITELINIKDDSIIFECELLNKEDNINLSSINNLVIKYCTKHELSFIKKIKKSNIFDNQFIHNITNKYYVMNLYKEVTDKQLNNDYIKITNDILSFLYKLHNIGIIHNDIKLDNILYDDINNRYILIDYGLSTYYNNNDLTVLESEAYNEYFINLTKHIFNIFPIKTDIICTKLADIILLFSIFKFKVNDNDFKLYINKLLLYYDAPNHLPAVLYSNI